ncbi:MAG: hypothetical protein ABIN04_09695, partial [Ginsengibacter sp.]
MLKKNIFLLVFLLLNSYLAFAQSSLFSKRTQLNAQYDPISPIANYEYSQQFKYGYNLNKGTDTIKRKLYLQEILQLLPLDMTADGRVSFLDKTFMDWLTRTGELPPDFSEMPSIPFLPDPLILEEGTKNIRIKTVKQWQQKRDWMKKSLQHYITGTYPMDPGNLIVRVLKET